MVRRLSHALLVLAAVLSVLPTSLPASAMPANLTAVATISRHTYSNEYHSASGILRLHNTGSNDMEVSCKVTVTWAKANGDFTQRSALIEAQVGAGIVRRLHYTAKLHDPDRAYLNVPTHAAPHCRKA